MRWFILFVDKCNGWTACATLCKLQIFPRGRLRAIEHSQNQACLLQLFPAAADALGFHSIAVFPHIPHTGGVKQVQPDAGIPQHHSLLQYIAGGARNGGHNGAVKPGQQVQQGAFAHIGAAHDGAVHALAQDGVCLIVPDQAVQLCLYPAQYPVQVVIVPVAAHKPGVLDKCRELAAEIGKYARVKLDDSDKQPGWKFAQWEMKGVPVRLEVGPRDIENGQCVLVRRDTREKVFVSLDELETAIPAQLEALRKDLYERALANREKRTWAATTMDEVKELAKANTGYIKTMWCGDLACEMKMKEEVGLSSRCMPFEQEHLSDVCPCCGKPAKTMVYWGVAY